MNYTENQASISAWATETFGPVGSNARVAARANEEMAELLRAVTANADPDKIAAETADVVIVLFRLGELNGFDPYQWSAAFEIDSLKGVFDEPGNVTLFYAACASRCLADLLVATTRGATCEMLGNLRRIVKYLDTLAICANFDLRAEVDKKMAINRAREWKLDGTGHGYHVRKVEPTAFAYTPDDQFDNNKPITLSPEAFEAFSRDVENPRPPTAELVELMRSCTRCGDPDPQCICYAR